MTVFWLCFWSSAALFFTAFLWLAAEIVFHLWNINRRRDWPSGDVDADLRRWRRPRRPGSSTSGTTRARWGFHGRGGGLV